MLVRILHMIECLNIEEAKLLSQQALNQAFEASDAGVASAKESSQVSI